MNQIQAGGKIEKGELIIFNEEVFYQQIQDIGFVNHVKITLEYGNKRTLNQNDYLWGGIVTPLFNALVDIGWEYEYPKQVYYDLESNFCKQTIINKETGEERESFTPFKNMDTETFASAIDRIREWVNSSNKIDIYLKSPAEYYQMSEWKYEQWKRGEITRTEAMKND